MANEVECTPRIVLPSSEVKMKYKIGTEVQEKNGRVRKKVDNAKWVARGRYEFNKSIRRLKPHERVFHINGDRADDHSRNLVAISFSVRRYEIKKSRVVWSPN